jgi:hypothetical protein
MGQLRATYSANGTKHALDEWSIVEDVRTGIRDQDPQILELVAKLRRLHVLIQDRGFADEAKEDKCAA